MEYIFSNVHTLLQAKVLAAELEKLGMKDLIVTARPERLTKIPVVRYGNSLDIKLPGEERFLNSKEMIVTCGNKKAFSDLMLNNGIFSPKFETLKTENMPKEFPFIIRETLNRGGGIGIHLIENEERAKEFVDLGYYWTPFVKMQFELRVHILGGKIARIFKKQRADDLEEEKYPIRNMHRGYRFSLRRNEVYPKILPLIEKFSSLMPKTFFVGLDIGWCHDEQSYFVIEANSAPNLSENTAKFYAEYIMESLK